MAKWRYLECPGDSWHFEANKSEGIQNHQRGSLLRLKVRQVGHGCIHTYCVSIQTNSILPISSYVTELFLVLTWWQIIIVTQWGGNAYFEVSQLLRRQPKHRAMIGLGFSCDGDIRGHVHRAVTGADIAVLTHYGGCVRPRGWSPTEGTLTIFSAEARGHVWDICVLWQEINTEWLSLEPDYAPGAKTLLNIFLFLDCKKLSKNLPIPLFMILVFLYW